MALVLDGTNGVSLVQDGVVTAADLASGAITASALPAGSVLQVVSVPNATEYNATAGGEVYLGYSASITPSSTSSKILVTVAAGIGETGTTYNWAIAFKLRRGTTTSDTQLVQQRHGHYESGTTETSEGYRSLSIVYLDSPSTTAEVTYGLFVANLDGGPAVRVNKNGSPLTITLMEIAG